MADLDPQTTGQAAHRSLAHLFRRMSTWVGIAMLIVLVIISRYNYLLFHNLSEIFRVAVAWAVFMLAWNTREMARNQALGFLGIAYLFVGIVDLVHTIAYKGMGVFPGETANLATQLWIAARYLESASLAIAPFWLQRRMNAVGVLAAYVTATSLLFLSIFAFDIFPLCFVEGVGLTPFKKVSEYVISATLLASIAHFALHREALDTTVLRLIVVSLALNVFAELAFTFYVSAYGLSNLIGHLFKLVSCYLIYVALVSTSLREPFRLVFRELQTEVERRQRKGVLLLEAKNAAEAANRAKSVFLTHMSHELRTPMNAVLGCSRQLLRADGLPDELRNHARIIQESGAHLLSIINEILELSRIEAGRDERNIETFDLHRLLDELERMFIVLAEDKGLHLAFQYDAGLVRQLSGDAGKVRQVMINLLGNAVKFTDAGGVEVTLTGPAATEVGTGDSVQIAMEVSDTGFGIAPEEAGKVFNAFEQTQSGERLKEGTGLGLHLGRRLSQLMGGDLELVRSGVGQGSTFRFSFQARADHPSVEVAHPQETAAAPLPALPSLVEGTVSPQVLIVDDQPMNRELLRNQLEEMGFAVVEAQSGQEAIDLFGRKRPDAVLMDRWMPVMDGFEATRALKALDGGKKTPVIILTADLGEQEAHAFDIAGADGFLHKPLEEEELFRTLCERLRLSPEA